MALATGTRLGPYEIVSLIGAGGMGEVYKATDGRLDRTVAIKVLPAHLSNSPEYKERLDREARIISQLAHPNVCALFDLGHEEGIDFFVMEMLEGETLAARLARGPLPASETRRFGAQIADALEAAHRHGVIHRDLKPANVMLTRAGVKLLDFGIAKPLTSPGSSADSTRIVALTEEGMAPGTLQYMAPEQIEGKPLTPRSDIFALGAVIYEMATGRPAFTGASRTALLTAILEGEPSAMSSLAPTSAGALESIVTTCLRKDPLDRWQSAHDVAIQLRAIADTGTAPVATRPAVGPSAWVRILPWAIAIIALAVLAVQQLRAPATVAPAALTQRRFPVPPPANHRFLQHVETSQMALSPDGSRLAHVMVGTTGFSIWMRRFDALEFEAVPGTDNATSVFWSPDGQSIGFVDAAGKMKRLALAGGSPVTICDVPVGTGISATWGRDGQILFAAVEGEAIFRVSTSGGVPQPIVRADRASGERRVNWPWYLPDGKHFLYISLRGHDGRIMLGEANQAPRELAAAASNVQYLEPGYLVFAREGTLLAQRVDLDQGQMVGDPISVAESVNYFLSTGAAQFATSLNGTIAFQSHPDVSRLAWFDRTGKELNTIGAEGDYLNLSISPDNRSVAFSRTQSRIGTYDLWTMDLERGVETRLTSDAGSEVSPLWTPDGRALVFTADRGAPPHLYRKDLATGTEHEVLPGSRFQAPQSVTPDGSTIIYTQRTVRGDNDVLSVGRAGQPAGLFTSTFDEREARLSPDGRMLAVVSDESGSNELYLSAFPAAGPRTRISGAGGFAARWSRTGQELIYRADGGLVMAIQVQQLASTGVITVGKPAELFRLPPARTLVDYDVSADSQRFLGIIRKELSAQQPLTVVVNALR